MSKEGFLKTYGIVLIFLSACGICMVVLLYTLEDRPSDIRLFVIFFILMGGWYLTTGVGIFLRGKWGYFFFKSFLYFLLLGFPIGTFISYKSLQYIKRNDIKTLFSFASRSGDELKNFK
jgi:hypothetical protein